MNKYNKIYMLAPYRYATGGVELCHQLVDRLRNLQLEAYIVYVSETGEICNDTTVTESYKKYNIEIATTIEDKKENILVLPEVFFEFSCKYKAIQIGCWWMSVDNHYLTSTLLEALCFHKSWINRLKILKRYFINGQYHTKCSLSYLKAEEQRITHYYQSIYAQYHLYSNGFSKVLPLSDYINKELFQTENSSIKEDIVLYNPAKGYKFTQTLIKQVPEIKFIPLKGYNRNELNELFRKAKLYIDFGNFPGKDRLPREAVINGCCIITGKLGASFFYEDVPIPESYKFEVKSKYIPQIKEKIKYVLKNYHVCFPDFNFYRQRVSQEEHIFYQEIEQIFIK